jgi:hypothetical protein
VNGPGTAILICRSVFAAADDVPRIIEIHAVERHRKTVRVAFAANFAIGEDCRGAFLIAGAHSRRHSLAEHLTVDQP